MNGRYSPPLWRPCLSFLSLRLGVTAEQEMRNENGDKAPKIGLVLSLVSLSRLLQTPRVEPIYIYKRCVVSGFDPNKLDSQTTF